MALEEEAHRVSLDLRQAREEKEEAQRLVDENNNGTFFRKGWEVEASAKAEAFGCERRCCGM
jgi:hypothetical protein